MPYSATSAAATSSWVESGFEAHSTTSAPPAFSVAHQVRRLGRHVQARRRCGCRASGCSCVEALADRARARASAGRPTRSACTTLVGEPEVLDVVPCCRAHAYSSVSVRCALPSGTSARRNRPRLEVRHALEIRESCLDLVEREFLQPLAAERLDREGGDDGAVDRGAAAALRRRAPSPRGSRGTRRTLRRTRRRRRSGRRPSPAGSRGRRRSRRR